EKAAGDSDYEYQPLMKKEAINKKDEDIPDVEPVLSHPDKLLASPAARKLAADSGISLKEIAGRTSGQPVKRADVEQYLAAEREKVEQDSQDYYLVETSPMRKVIAARMVESISCIPYYTISVDIDMMEAILLRKLLNDHPKNNSIKVSFNDIIIKCASKAIEKYPMINSTFDREKIRVYKNVNFGLAVGIENGLVVPVVKETNGKSIPEIASLNAANIEKAKTGRLQQADMTGGTITLSNLGMYGVKCFTAIINQPESCILAVGSIEERAVAVNGQLAVKHMLTVTASFDHRVIDGTVGAAFLKEVKELLETPQLLLL
ncbi:MAG: 2-oxo acid dehydrogenase subunit E2, partial [Ruminiclostridium sp.]|nr:2-oxo acid dehydrogenase subunit E2 [Ruminiclostridium sp.]